MLLAQLALVVYWFWTYTPALLSMRVLFWRTVVIFGYAIIAADRDSGGLLDFVCDWMVVAHVIGIALAYWNRDSRFFTYRYGGCQEI